MTGVGEPRAAEPGDVCVLVEPRGEDVVALRREQRELQRLCGGRIHEPVHLTVQRFRIAGSGPVQDLVRDLMGEMEALSSFPVVAGSLVQMEHAFWESRLIRWRVRVTPALREFCEAVEGLLVEREMVPHFPLERGWEPRYVTALEDTETGALDRGHEERVFPRLLFEARRVLLSRVEERRVFKTLGECELTGG